MMKIQEHNIETGEIIEREATEAEIADFEAAANAAFLKDKMRADKAAAKAELLEKLGITADEAKLLLS